MSGEATKQDVQRIYDKLDGLQESVIENRILGKARDESLARIEGRLVIANEDSEEFKKKLLTLWAHCKTALPSGKSRTGIKKFIGGRLLRSLLSVVVGP